MTYLQKVEAIASLLGNMLNNSNNCLEDKKVQEFIDNIYGAFITYGNIDILSRIVGLGEIKEATEELLK